MGGGEGREGGREGGRERERGGGNEAYQVTYIILIPVSSALGDTYTSAKLKKTSPRHIKVMATTFNGVYLFPAVI